MLKSVQQKEIGKAHPRVSSVSTVLYLKEFVPLIWVQWSPLFREMSFMLLLLLPLWSPSLPFVFLFLSNGIRQHMVSSMQARKVTFNLISLPLVVALNGGKPFLLLTFVKPPSSTGVIWKKYYISDREIVSLLPLSLSLSLSFSLSLSLSLSLSCQYAYVYVCVCVLGECISRNEREF